MPVMRGIILFVLAVLLWTGMAYIIHRLAHWRGSCSILYRLHAVHHGPRYAGGSGQLRWHHFLLCFGSPAETLDIWITLTLPALLICLVLPMQGLLLFMFHYFYEIFCSDGQLDHNPNLSGPITRTFAWGDYHLRHHRDPSRNYGLILTVWDYVFSTAT